MSLFSLLPCPASLPSSPAPRPGPGAGGRHGPSHQPAAGPGPQGQPTALTRTLNTQRQRLTPLTHTRSHSRRLRGSRPAQARPTSTSSSTRGWRAGAPEQRQLHTHEQLQGHRRGSRRCCVRQHSRRSSSSGSRCVAVWCVPWAAAARCDCCAAGAELSQ
jgi:hypothetical protein